MRRAPARRLGVAAEPVPHRRQQALGEGVLLARAEAGEERGGEDVGRHPALDRGGDRPAALARILDEARVLGQARALGEGRGGEVEQPRGDHAAAPPELRDLGERQGVALACGDLLAGGAVQQIEALGVGLHQAVLDAVVDHLHEVAGAGRAAVEEALLGVAAE